MNLVDYSFSRPAPAQLKAAGAEGVLRYVSSDAAKAITVAEAAALRASGLLFGLVYEDGPMDFSGGANAGVAKARIAAPILAGLERSGHWVTDRPVYAAVDGNLAQSAYVDTWEGIHAFASSLGRQDACYGPRPFLRWLEQQHDVRYLWELGSSSFNIGPEPANKTLQQLVAVPAGCKSLDGVDWDTALVSDWGQFPAPVTTPLAVAASQIGTTDPAPYWARIWPDHPANAVDWCAIFVSWCFAAAGRPLPKMDETVVTSGYAWCPDAETWAKVNGWWTATPVPGDIVLYCWDGSGTPEHTGIVESVNPDGSLVAIEGNTGSPAGVYRETRDRSVIVGFLRPITPAPAPYSPSSPEESMLFLAKSFDGPATLLYDVQSQTCRGVSLAEARMYEQVGIKNYGATLDNAVLSTFGRVG